MNAWYAVVNSAIPTPCTARAPSSHAIPPLTAGMKGKTGWANPYKSGPPPNRIAPTTSTGLCPHRSDNIPASGRASNAARANTHVARPPLSPPQAGGVVGGWGAAHGDHVQGKRGEKRLETEE